MKVRLLLSVCALAVSSSGCVILFNMPANRFVSPESQEGFGNGHVDLGFGGSEQVVLSADAGTVLANANSPAMRRANAQSRFAAEFGVVDRLDVGIRGSLATNEPAFLEGKYQLIGPSRQKADAGDVSLAVTGALGGFRGTGTTNGTGTYTIKTDAFEVAAIGGFRFSKSAMLYGGYFFGAFSFSGTQTLDSGLLRVFEGEARRNGLNMGVELGQGMFRVKAEIAQSWANVDLSSASRPYAGLMASIHF